MPRTTGSKRETDEKENEMLKLAEIKEGKYKMQGRKDRAGHRQRLEAVKAEYGVDAINAIREINDLEGQIAFYGEHGNDEDVEILLSRQVKIAEDNSIEVA